MVGGKACGGEEVHRRGRRPARGADAPLRGPAPQRRPAEGARTAGLVPVLGDGVLSQVAPQALALSPELGVKAHTLWCNALRTSLS